MIKNGLIIIHNEIIKSLLLFIQGKKHLFCYDVFKDNEYQIGGKKNENQYVSK